MKNPYSPVYMTCIEEAKKDLRAKARPELVSMPESIDEYDTVILAYPNYWGTKFQSFDVLKPVNISSSGRARRDTAQYRELTDRSIARSQIDTRAARMCYVLTGQLTLLLGL